MMKLYRFLRGLVFPTVLSILCVSQLEAQGTKRIQSTLDAERVGIEASLVTQGNQPAAITGVSRPNSTLRTLKGGGILYDNGPIVTGACVATGDLESLVQLPVLGTWGWSANATYYVTDDFTVPVGQTWTIANADVFVYQTNSGIVPTITGVQARIWDGDPSLPGSAVIWGDMVTNRMVAVNFSGVYRVLDGASCNTQRPIMTANIDVENLVLGAGTYWIEYNTTGTLGIGPYIPSVTILGTFDTGNAMQYAAPNYVPMVDGIHPQGLPFVLYGNAGAGGPTINTHPASLNACNNTPVSFSVTAAGTGTLYYQWQKNGVDIPGATGSTYTIVMIFPQDAGNYRCVVTDDNGSVNSNDATLMITVVATPDLNGTFQLCQGSTATYTTNGNMAYYEWRLSGGGTILTGSGTNSIQVQWSTPGEHTVFVRFVSGTCYSPTQQKVVTVHPLPVPVVNGPVNVCMLTPAVFETQTGMTGYQWTLSPGGTFISGSNAYQAVVQWSTAGPHTITVTYTSAFGCPAPAAGTKSVTVITQPVPTIMGANNTCLDGSTHVYWTEAGMRNYEWQTSAGGTIVSGNGTNQVEVIWTEGGRQWITVIYTNQAGCVPRSAARADVLLNPLPGPAGPIRGMVSHNGPAYYVEYRIDRVPNADTYVWTLPAGAVVRSGAGTWSIRVDFPSAPINGVATVYALNSCGKGATSPPLEIKINNAEPDLLKSLGTGLTEGDLPLMALRIYPVPNQGNFTIALSADGDQSCRIQVVNSMGTTLYSWSGEVNETLMQQEIDLPNAADGLYFAVITLKDKRIVRKVMIMQ